MFKVQPGATYILKWKHQESVPVSIRKHICLFHVIMFKHVPKVPPKKQSHPSAKQT